VDLGVGQVSVWLPAEGEMSVDIGMGVGQTIIRVPRGLGVRVSTDRGLVGLDLPGDFSGADAGYTSPGYSSGQPGRITVSQGGHDLHPVQRLRYDTTQGGGRAAALSSF
jgi:hypothetical protein